MLVFLTADFSRAYATSVSFFGARDLNFALDPRAAAAMEARLGGIAAVSDQKSRTSQYKEVLDELLSGDGDTEGLKLMVTHMLSDDVPLVISRQVLQTLCQDLQRLPSERHKETADFALEKITPRVVSFEEQVSVLREGLSQLYQDERLWSRAAQVLSGIDLDSGIRVLSDEYKLQKCVQIAALYLEDDDALNAETYIKKASFLLGACKVRLPLIRIRQPPKKAPPTGFSGPMIITNLNHTERDPTLTSPWDRTSRDSSRETRSRTEGQRLDEKRVP